MGCEGTHPGGIRLTKKLLDKARETGLWEGKGPVLDVGCGCGETVFHLAAQGIACTGIDMEKLWEEPGTKSGLAFHQVSLMEYRPKQRYRMVTAECVLSLLEIPEALEKISNLLEEKGLLLVSDLFTDSKEEFSRKNWERNFQRQRFRLLDWEEEACFFREYMARWVWEKGSFPWKDRQMSYFGAVLVKEGKIADGIKEETHGAGAGRI
ncbi:MAG: class I SAM-dependent methyltransferase [Ruminococcus sp.]|jgi:SAM-dependent methyltransferase